MPTRNGFKQPQPELNNETLRKLQYEMDALKLECYEMPYMPDDRIMVVKWEKIREGKPHITQRGTWAIAKSFDRLVAQMSPEDRKLWQELNIIPKPLDAEHGRMMAEAMMPEMVRYDLCL